MTRKSRAHITSSRSVELLKIFCGCAGTDAIDVIDGECYLVVDEAVCGRDN